MKQPLFPMMVVQIPPHGEAIALPMTRNLCKGEVAMQYSSTAKDIALKILEEYKWSLCPILADAMEEGGYPNAAVLKELRSYPMSPGNLDILCEVAGVGSKWDFFLPGVKKLEGDELRVEIHGERP